MTAKLEHSKLPKIGSATKASNAHHAHDKNLAAQRSKHPTNVPLPVTKVPDGVKRK